MTELTTKFITTRHHWHTLFFQIHYSVKRSETDSITEFFVFRQVKGWLSLNTSWLGHLLRKWKDSPSAILQPKFLFTVCWCNTSRSLLYICADLRSGFDFCFLQENGSELFLNECSNDYFAEMQDNSSKWKQLFCS